ncbi:heavy metal-responsive transcriptional regulator [Arthrobacter sp. H35-D1]|uniref:heavy metal-responsive transcriptional regulator n=1 Tax=Arthrobacter sp. H35-D1 TaxID=3046202 RepID=UPI0024BB2EC3|nr:heavy metal-responsive transcriptional regulator [Arthrobacter sp. H35-D1]MDJ0311753.1 heavy metal-responsive transcriptional regulator [Arthrobacter sp. H35-D1]
MRIGELALATGVNTQTLRFYERRGLLPLAEREMNGYRHYDQAAASHIRFIRGAQAVGMTLADIKSILVIRQDGKVPCEHVTALLIRKLEDVRARQQELALLETELQNLIDTSRDLDPVDCTAGSVCQIIPHPHP